MPEQELEDIDQRIRCFSEFGDNLLIRIESSKFTDKDYEDRVLNHLPMGRLGTVEDLIGPAIFLASSASDFMTGHILVVDGGWTCV